MNLNQTINLVKATVAVVCVGAAAAQPLQLRVRMYSRVEASPSILNSAATEAARLLRGVPVRLSWLNCAAPAHPAKCEAPETPTDLPIRLLPKALAEASPNTLGMAMWSVSGGSAVLFFDRALSLRTPGIFLAHILGRAMAHEVVHLLLGFGPRGFGPHSDQGLMRAQWSPEDLRRHSGADLGLSADDVDLIRAGVARRVQFANTLPTSNTGSE
jgi:hypothetical protein